MANIFLRHEAVNQAIDDMDRTAKTMANATDELIGLLQQFGNSFQGAAAQAFAVLSSNRAKINSDLTETFSTGSTALSNMHQNMIDGDKQAAARLGG